MKIKFLIFNNKHKNVYYYYFNIYVHSIGGIQNPDIVKVNCIAMILVQ